MSRSNLTPKQLARAVGVSESSMKRWIDSGRVRALRTEGGHRRIPLEEAVRFVRQSELELVAPELLGLDHLAGVSVNGVGSVDGMGEPLRSHLEQGRSAEALALLTGRFLAGESIADLCDGPIRSAMGAIGEVWRHRDDGIMIERRATDICNQFLNQIRSLLGRPDSSWAAVGGALSGDPYLLPPLAATVVLLEEGVDAQNLGPDTPARALIQAADRAAARLVYVSLSVVEDVDATLTALRELRAHCQQADRALMIGGQSADRVARAPDLRDLPSGRSFRELVGFIRGLRAASRVAPG